jgi:transposase
MNTMKKARRAGEWRRQRAWELHQQGWWQKDIAAALGVSRAAVCQWIKCAREQGVEGLRSRPPPGAPSKLSAEQRAQLPVLLAHGAEAHGFRGEVWTAPRVAVVIERAFGVRSHPVHVGRRLRQAGWSRQRPIQRATQRDAAAVRRWYEERWPAINKRRATKATRSSGETSRGSLCCRTLSRRGRHAERRQCCA